MTPSISPERYIHLDQEYFFAVSECTVFILICVLSNPFVTTGDSSHELQNATYTLWVTIVTGHKN